VEGAGTNAGPFCAFEDLGDEGDDLRFRLHCPKSADNSVRAFLVPSNDSWNLRLDGSNLESGYLDFLVDDAVEDGTLEGYVVIRKNVLNYTPGSFSSGSAAPTARGLYLPERPLYPVQAAAEELVLWAASFLIDDAAAVSGARAPSALAVTATGGELTVDSVAFAEPNVMFGGLAKETASVSSTASVHRVVRSETEDFAIVDETGAVIADIDDVVYTTVAQRVLVAALQSARGANQAEWSRASLSTNEDIPARTAGEVGYDMRSAWKRACFIPLSITLDASAVITAATLCPGVQVTSDEFSGDARVFVDFGAVQAGGFFALVVHRPTGGCYAIVETELAQGSFNFTVDVGTLTGVFDIFILANLDNER
jgi:hypothetical protein